MLKENTAVLESQQVTWLMGGKGTDHWKHPYEFIMYNSNNKCITATID